MCVVSFIFFPVHFNVTIKARLLTLNACPLLFYFFPCLFLLVLSFCFIISEKLAIKLSFVDLFIFSWNLTKPRKYKWQNKCTWKKHTTTLTKYFVDICFAIFLLFFSDWFHHNSVWPNRLRSVRTSICRLNKKKNENEQGNKKCSMVTELNNDDLLCIGLKEQM